MIADADAVDTTHCAVQYELLRSQVIGATSDVVSVQAAPRSCGIGLALMLREGMPGWLKAVQAVIKVSAVPQINCSVQPVAPDACARSIGMSSWLSRAQRQDITTLLTSLLSTRCIDGFSPREGYRSCQ